MTNLLALGQCSFICENSSGFANILFPHQNCCWFKLKEETNKTKNYEFWICFACLKLDFGIIVNLIYKSCIWNSETQLPALYFHKANGLIYWLVKFCKKFSNHLLSKTKLADLFCIGKSNKLLIKSLQWASGSKYKHFQCWFGENYVIVFGLDFLQFWWEPDSEYWCIRFVADSFVWNHVIWFGWSVLLDESYHGFKQGYTHGTWYFSYCHFWPDHAAACWSETDWSWWYS